MITIFNEGQRTQLPRACYHHTVKRTQATWSVVTALVLIGLLLLIDPNIWNKFHASGFTSFHQIGTFSFCFPWNETFFVKICSKSKNTTRKIFRTMNDKKFWDEAKVSKWRFFSFKSSFRNFLESWRTFLLLPSLKIGQKPSVGN